MKDVTAVPKFSSKDKLADFLKATLSANDDLLNSDIADNLHSELQVLYTEEADVDYENSYDDSYSDN